MISKKKKDDNILLRTRTVDDLPRPPHKPKMSEYIKDGKVIDAICARRYYGEDDTPVGPLAYRLNVGKHIKIVKTFVDIKGNTYAVFEHVKGLFGSYDVPPNAPVVEVGDMMVVLMKGSTTTEIRARPSVRVLAEKALPKGEKKLSTMQIAMLLEMLQNLDSLGE